MKKPPDNIAKHCFKKGQSGNPKGRPKLPDISEAIAKVLADKKEGMTALEAVLIALRNRAIKGDVRAAQELMDRAYGKSKQQMDITTQGEPITKYTIEIIDGKHPGDKDISAE
jgi:hypothetical protein